MRAASVNTGGACGENIKRGNQITRFLCPRTLSKVGLKPSPNFDILRSNAQNGLFNSSNAVFNYAVTFYNLRENPCHKAGSIGKKNAEEMKYWTKAEFEKFIAAVSDKPTSIHDIRHSHCALCFSLGFSPLEVAERLGHDDPKTTLRIYAHVYPEAGKQISDKLEELHGS